MNWLLFSFFTAICEASKDIFSKKGLAKVDVYIVAWASRLYSIPFLLPVFFIVDIPDIKPSFWVALCIGGGLNVVTTILYMKSISSSELSLSVPLIAFTPLFLLLTSPLIIGEFPSIMGIFGVVLIVIGSYFLNLKQTKGDLLAPFKLLMTQKGPRYMLIVAFIWSISSNFDKMGVMASSPLIWAVSINLFIALAMMPLVLFKSSANLGQLSKNFWNLLPIGLFSAATLIFQMLAINIALVAYVISIKRTSAILVVLAGYFIFKEKSAGYRLVGTVIMVAGIFLISFL